GMHVPLETLTAQVEHPFDFSFPLDLQGMSTLAINPSGNQTVMTLKSSWPHPSFGGSYLPRQRHIDDTGFSASWLVTNLARNNTTQSGATAPAGGDQFSVEFIDPINVYLLSERAVKYGVMFVVLIFTAFFMFEVLKNLRIHPMQYLLVGLAMAMFFLLIISLSEHIPFWVAYVASGAACVALIGIYMAGMLQNIRTAFGFSSAIGMLYAVLYGVLKSEDNALLMGTLVLFGGLSIVMLLTRHMDWYGFSKESNPD
ncbi:partial Inner membrane protein CreD, partial [Anaerolineae bacterium]